MTPQYLPGLQLSTLRKKPRSAQQKLIDPRLRTPTNSIDTSLANLNSDTNNLLRTALAQRQLNEKGWSHTFVKRVQPNYIYRPNDAREKSLNSDSDAATQDRLIQAE